MRDPEMISRAEQAAAALERAWERWRIMHGLSAEPMPPVSSYVGYSIEEPWGRPRVVFGVDASEAELLAALLDRHECVGPYYEAGRDEAGAGGAVTAAHPVDPLLDEARSRIPAPAQAAEEESGSRWARVAQPSADALAGDDAGPGEIAHDLPGYHGRPVPSDDGGAEGRPRDVPHPDERAGATAQAGEHRAARRGERRGELGRPARRDRRTGGGRQRSRQQPGEPGTQRAGAERQEAQADTSLAPAAAAETPARQDRAEEAGRERPAEAGWRDGGNAGEHHAAEEDWDQAADADWDDADHGHAEDAGWGHTGNAAWDRAGEAGRDQASEAGWEPPGGSGEDQQGNGARGHLGATGWDRARDGAGDAGWERPEDAGQDGPGDAGVGYVTETGWSRAGDAGPDRAADAGWHHETDRAPGAAGWDQARDSGGRDQAREEGLGRPGDAALDALGAGGREPGARAGRRDLPGLGAAGGRSDTIAAELAGWASGELPGQASARLAAWAAIGGVPAAGHQPAATSGLGSPGTAEPVR
jgi:hypothetical protein